MTLMGLTLYILSLLSRTPSFGTIITLQSAIGHESYAVHNQYITTGPHLIRNT